MMQGVVVVGTANSGLSIRRPEHTGDRSGEFTELTYESLPALAACTPSFRIREDCAPEMRYVLSVVISEQFWSRWSVFLTFV